MMGGRIVCTGSGLHCNTPWTLPFHPHSALTLTPGDSRVDMPTVVTSHSPVFRVEQTGQSGVERKQNHATVQWCESTQNTGRFQQLLLGKKGRGKASGRCSLNVCPM